MFYQLGLRQFGNFGRLKLDPAPPLRALISLAVESENGIERSGLKKESVVDVCAAPMPCDTVGSPSGQAIFKTLAARRAMLAEYFSLSINDENEVESLPLLLRAYTPNLDKLPLFLMRLGPEVRMISRRARQVLKEPPKGGLDERARLFRHVSSGACIFLRPRASSSDGTVDRCRC